MTNKTTFSPKLLEIFVALVREEIGEERLSVILGKSNLPRRWANSPDLGSLSETEAAESYAGLQSAIRAYYGRSARGILIRVGSSFFKALLKNASFKEKTQAKLLKGLPQTSRRKAAMELLIRLLDTPPEGMTVHTLDLNLLLVDKHSPSAHNQHDDEAICYVTIGLIREAIYWSMGKDAQIEETSCKAMGSEACEFQILFGES